MKYAISLLFAVTSLFVSANTIHADFLESFTGTPSPRVNYWSSQQDGGWASNFDISIHSRDYGTWNVLEPVDSDHGPNCEPPMLRSSNVSRANQNYTVTGFDGWTAIVDPDDPRSIYPDPVTGELLPNRIIGEGLHTISAYEDMVYQCANHMMTALHASGYGVIYITPNHMIDMSQGYAELKFDVSSFQQSSRDWLDVWFTPYEDHLQLPLLSGLPDLGGEPFSGFHIEWVDSQDSAAPQGFSQDTILYDHVTGNSSERGANSCIERGIAGCEGSGDPVEVTNYYGLFPDRRRRDTRIIRLYPDHIQIGIQVDPNDETHINWLHEANIDIGTGQYVVQLGHHSYNPNKKNCYPDRWTLDSNYIDPGHPVVTELDVRNDPSLTLGDPMYTTTQGICGETTWHWDEFNISPSVPFTIIHADKRKLTNRSGELVHFEAPAPANAHLRFSGFRDVDYGSTQPSSPTQYSEIEYSLDGQTWQVAALQRQREYDYSFSGYWQPIPAGTQDVYIRERQGYGGGEYHVRDISIFATDYVAPPPQQLVGDFDTDNVVDFADYRTVIERLMGSIGSIFDISSVLANFGRRAN